MKSTPRNSSATNRTRRTDIIRPSIALVMNIATGGGTLVHEIVHPFMAANFAACPSWFNEGLASLYEQSGEEDGQIKGFVNWRLDGLQRTIRAGRLPTFETLCGTTTDEFYHHDKGANYGQARYLCLYLQEHGLLKKFYDEFRDSAKARFNRIPHAAVGARRKRYGRLPKTLGSLGACHSGGLVSLASASRLPRPRLRSRGSRAIRIRSAVCRFLVRSASLVGTHTLRWPTTCIDTGVW